MEKFEFTCPNCQKHCEKPWYRSPEYRSKYYEKKTENSFCSIQCKRVFANKRQAVPCDWCGDSVVKKQRELRDSKSGKVFCSRSCSASYNNTQKRKSKRSKMEKALLGLLVEEFPAVEFIANDKTYLDGYELDIVIPSIKLAIEWNGIVHYRPIYGQAKLDNIQKRDAEKQELALAKGIELIVVPDLVSSETYLREAFINIKKIVQSKMVG